MNSKEKTCKDCLHYEVCKFVNAQAVEFARAENCKLFADKNGYRKSVDVAREVINAFEQAVNAEAHFECSITGYRYPVVDVSEIAYVAEELRKKYESEGAE